MRADRSAALGRPRHQALTGVSGDFVALAQDRRRVRASMERMAGLGIKTVRFPVAWDQVQEREGVFDWSRIDRLHRELVWYGLTAVPVVVGRPTWTVGSASGVRRQSLDGGRESGLEAMGRFAVLLRSHLRRHGDRVAAMEIWSEPNASSGRLAVDPGAFAEMLAAVEVAFAEDSAGSACPLIAGGVVIGPDRSWVDYVDAVSERAPSAQLGAHIPAPGKALAAAPAAHFSSAVGAVAARARGSRLWLTSEIPQCKSRPDQQALTAAWLETASDPACAAFFTASHAPLPDLDAAPAEAIWKRSA